MITVGPCPACYTEQRIFFGTILGVEVRACVGCVCALCAYGRTSRRDLPAFQNTPPKLTTTTTKQSDVTQTHIHTLTLSHTHCKWDSRTWTRPSSSARTAAPTSRSSGARSGQCSVRMRWDDVVSSCVLKLPQAHHRQLSPSFSPSIHMSFLAFLPYPS